MKVGPVSTAVGGPHRESAAETETPPSVRTEPTVQHPRAKQEPYSAVKAATTAEPGRAASGEEAKVYPLAAGW